MSSTSPTMPSFPSQSQGPKCLQLSVSWLQTWLPKLSSDAFKLYAEIALHFDIHGAIGIRGLDECFGAGSTDRFEAENDNLVKSGLVELVKKDKLIYFHLPHRDPSGFHHPTPVLPSIKEALNFQRHMNEEILRVSSLDDTEELRNEYFETYPELREEFTVYQETRDDDSPRWRLWLELSRLLIREFETRFGPLKSTYHTVFKESAAQILSHKLNIVDAVTLEVFEQRDRVFPEVAENWLVTSSDEAFMTHPIISTLSERYDVGPAQIFVNTLERLAQSDFVVAEVDAKGRLIDLLLPSTTGLTKSEERILFLLPEERDGGQDSERNRERARRACNKYANYLMERGAQVLHEFVKRDKVPALDALLESIAMRVNESLDLIPNRVDEDPISVDHVLEKYNVCREEEQGTAASESPA